MSTGIDKVKVGQRVLRLWYKNNQPCIQFGTVSRVTKTTCDIVDSDGVTEKSVTRIDCHRGWYRHDWLAAIDAEIEYYFKAKAPDYLFPSKHPFKDASVKALVYAVNRLWRFRKKCLKKLNRNR